MARERTQTEFLDDAMRRVEFDGALRLRADATLDRSASDEPLIADALRAPQTPPHHAEGPCLRDHLRLMLQTLYAVLDGTLRLTNVEEFARLKGFEGEVKEMEETIKENAALFEVFALCHDAAKWSLTYFDAPEGSRGWGLGFVNDRREGTDPETHVALARRRDDFLARFNAFASEHPGLSGSEAEAEFFEAFRIEVHYAGHGRAIHSPTYHGLLERVSKKFSLTPRNVDLLETLITHHLDPVDDFSSSKSKPALITRYNALADKHGYDADDFIDLLQACVLLDTVCGSRRVGTPAHDASVIERFLRSEHDFAPWRRAEKERRREQERTRARNAAFRETKLDGVALMDLLDMEPGPKFGETLRRVHQAIADGTPLPKFGKNIDKELETRIEDYFERAFEKGE